MLCNAGMTTIDEIRTANLKHLVDGWGGTTKFAERIGKSASQVSQWLNRSLNSVTQRPRVISTTSCREIELVLGLRKGWMDQSNSETSLYEEPNLSSMANAHRSYIVSMGLAAEEFLPIRLVVFQALPGARAYKTEPEDGAEQALSVSSVWLDIKRFTLEALLATKVRGESMEPSLYDGDKIVINTADTTPADGAIFLLIYEDEVVIKRLIRDAGHWWLTSDNADQRRFHRKVWSEDESPIVGRVVRRETDRI
jgi:hypothetical protein